MNLPEGDEHVVDDIPTENVWIIEAPLHLPQLILLLLLLLLLLLPLLLLLLLLLLCSWASGPP